MQQMKIEELIPHPRNSEFFDDMSGDKWKEFLESIKTSGVIEPIVITQDKVIVSGHQRVRACKELGVAEILAEVKVYDNEDAILKDLLETNIRQRGTIGGSEVKLGRRIREMERIYGIKLGDNQYSVGSSNGTKPTQQDLAAQFGVDINTLKRAKSLPTLPVEIQELVEQGKISPSTASRLIARKDFSKSERMEYALRLAKIERLKAEERMKSGKADPTETFPQGGQGEVRDIVAAKTGIGSGKQFDKEKYIYENQLSAYANICRSGLTIQSLLLLNSADTGSGKQTV